MTAPDRPLVRARDVHKAFGSNEVLKGIDLDVAPGETVVILPGQQAEVDEFGNIHILI